MKINTKRIDEMVLALLYLDAFEELKGQYRTWKGYDWDALNRLYEKGYISNPVSKAKSVVFTDEGYIRAKELFERWFTDLSDANEPH